MSLPRAAKAPVRGDSKPILMGPLWAGAVAGPPRAATKLRRTAAATMRRWCWFMVNLLFGAVSWLASCQRCAPAAEGADESAGSEEDDADVDGAEDQEPPLGVDAHEVFEEYDQGGPDRRPHE